MTLARGDLPPEIVAPPPGPRARELCAELERFEAPGINTLAFGDAILWDEALGANVLDVDGNRFVDLTAGFGVAAVGHRHPDVVAAVERQSARLLHGLGDVHAHPARVELARRLCALAPVDEPRVYFAASGSDAVEVALKTAHLATGRSGVLAFAPAYHGLTLGALAATARAAFRRPFDDRLRPHVARLPFGAAAAEIDAALARPAGEAAIGCVLIEPLVGREGVVVPPPGWLGELAKICRRRGALLVADEVFTGFGRTGELFAVDHEGARPDILCCGKALGGGLPVAAAIGRRELMAAWGHPGEARHTATFVAHPVACAAALATLDVIAGERLVQRAGELGESIAGMMAPLDAHASVVEVRGRGALWGLEMASAEAAHALAARLLGRGILVLAGGAEGRVVQVVPPLTIAREQLDGALETLAGAVGG